MANPSAGTDRVFHIGDPGRTSAACAEKRLSSKIFQQQLSDTSEPWPVQYAMKLTLAACAEDDLSDVEDYAHLHKFYDAYVQDPDVTNALETEHEETAAGVESSPSITFH